MPGTSADFVLAQAEKGATVEAAKDAYIVALAADRDAQSKAAGEANAKALEAEKQAALAKQPKPGNQPVNGGPAGKSAEDTTDPVAEFNAAVKAKVVAGMERSAAINAAAKENPALHRGYLLATNKSAKAQRMLADKFEG